MTPWRQAMRCVLWGIGLTSITLNFWNLQHLLPMVGSILLMLGFRTLRQENGCTAQLLAAVHSPGGAAGGLCHRHGHRPVPAGPLAGDGHSLDLERPVLAGAWAVVGA